MTMTFQNLNMPPPCNCFIWALCHLNLLGFSKDTSAFTNWSISGISLWLNDMQLPPFKQWSQIVMLISFRYVHIWNHLSVIRDLGLRKVILACQLFRQTWYYLPDLAILLPKCWMGGMRLYTPLTKLLKKVKRTSFLNLQSFKSFNNAREFVVHLGKKKMPFLTFPACF